MKLDDILGIDVRNPLHRRARRMVDGDRRLIGNLRTLRQLKGLSQQSVADRMQVSQSAVARIESGERDPRLSTLRRYAMAIGAVVEHDVLDDERPVPVAPPGGQHMEVAWTRANLLVPGDKAARSRQ